MNDQEYVRFREIQENNLNEDRTTKKRKDAEGEVEKLKLSVAKLEANSQGWNEWKRLSSRPAQLEAQKEEAIAEKARLDESLEKAEQEASDLHRSRKELDLALSEGDMLVVEVYRISKEQGKVDKLKMTLQSYGERESLEEAQKHLKELASKKDKAMTDLQAKNRELQKLTATHLRVTNDKTRAERELDNAATSLRLKQEWDKKKEELKEREKTLQGELRELKAKEQPLRQQMQEKNNTYTRARDQARALVDRVQNAAQECQTEDQAFSRLQRGVAAGEARNLPETLASIQAKLQEVEEAVEQHEQNARESERTMTGKVLQSDKQVHHKKILKDNIEYRGYNRELEERRKEVAAVEAEIAETDSQDVRGKIVELNREMLKRTKKRAELEGGLHVMKDQIRGTEDKLATEAYHHIEEKHRRKMIEHRTTEMAVTDLDKYWTALDKALLRFHTMKITDINKIIRELWAMTYSGEDIDMIEIVSGDDDDVGKAKRSYNYRVVMRKNDATLDMKDAAARGRGFALRGQASVVIRLALAETFCVSCGILALDEPTTNLDHNNKVGLAHALAKIISSRSRQSNFQLITITHDEEFVQTMRTELGTQGGFSMPEFYWRISREEMSRGKFYSRIDRLDWEDM